MAILYTSGQTRALYYAEHVYVSIFTNYFKDVRPNADDISTDVYIDFGIASVDHLDEVSGTLTTSCFINVKWVDGRLSWEPDLFGKVFYISVPQNNVWLPELFLSNPANELKALSEAKSQVTIFSNGSIIWYAGGVLRSKCPANVIYYPFDVQRCDILLHVWGFLPWEINLMTFTDTIDLEYYRENG